MTLPLLLIAAVADNGVIGRDNQLIWRLKTDLRRFRALTMGRPIIMGRKTFESIGKPLPGRQTIVLTRDTSFEPDDVIITHDLAEALRIGQDEAVRMGADSVAVVGGAEIYGETLPLCQGMRLTLVHARPEGDAHFPDYDRAAFIETWREEHPAGPDDDHAFTFVDLSRRA